MLTYFEHQRLCFVVFVYFVSAPVSDIPNDIVISDRNQSHADRSYLVVH